MKSATSLDSSPSVSPSSDKRLWSNLRNKIGVLLEEKSKHHEPTVDRESETSKTLENDTMLLLKGFDSVSNTLSQLSSNLDNALQGVIELAKPTLSEILHSSLKVDQIQQQQHNEQEEEESKGEKRKHECEFEQKEDSSNEEEIRPK